MTVRRWDARRDGPPTEAAMRRALVALGYEVARYDYPPGTRFGAHTHGVDKIDGVVAGRFRITMGADAVVLEAGDWVEVPAGAEHAAEVVGDEGVVSLDAVRARR